MRVIHANKLKNECTHRVPFFKGVRATLMKSVFIVLFAFSSISSAETFEGKAEFIDSTEITHYCPEEAFCINPYWNRYRIKAVSILTGEHIEILAAYRHTHRHDTKYVWRFELLESNEHPEKSLIKANWVISNLDVRVDDENEP